MWGQSLISAKAPGQDQPTGRPPGADSRTCLAETPCTHCASPCPGLWLPRLGISSSSCSVTAASAAPSPCVLCLSQLSPSGEAAGSPWPYGELPTLQLVAFLGWVCPLAVQSPHLAPRSLPQRLLPCAHNASDLAWVVWLNPALFSSMSVLTARSAAGGPPKTEQ